MLLLLYKTIITGISTHFTDSVPLIYLFKRIEFRFLRVPNFTNQKLKPLSDDSSCFSVKKEFF